MTDFVELKNDDLMEIEGGWVPFGIAVGLIGLAVAIGVAAGNAYNNWGNRVCSTCGGLTPRR